MSETSSGTPAGWYPDQTTADTIRYWDGVGWTAHRARALPSPRDYWSRYRHRCLTTAGVLGALGAVIGFMGRMSTVAVPEGGSYAYALGECVGTAIVTMLVMFVCAFVVNLVVAIIP